MTERSELERITEANRRYLQRYRDNGKIMGVIEEVARFDTFVSVARTNRQRHFAERAERTIRRLQDAGAADVSIDPGFAAFAWAPWWHISQIWLVEGAGDFEFDTAVEQISRLWANAIGLQEPTTKPGDA